MKNNITYEDTDIFSHWYTWPEMSDPDSICHKEWINRSNIMFKDEFIKRIEIAHKKRESVIWIVCKHSLLVSKIIKFASWN